MIDAMVQRGFAQRTQAIYIQAIVCMVRHYRRDPVTYSAHEVQAYLLHMVKERHLSYSTMNQAACALQFLFQVVLGHPREHFQIVFAKAPAKHPSFWRARNCTPVCCLRQCVQAHTAANHLRHRHLLCLRKIPPVGQCWNSIRIHNKERK